MFDTRDEVFQAAASQYGFDIWLMCQPPNSPNLNILDLGFLVSYNHYNIRFIQIDVKHIAYRRLCCGTHPGELWDIFAPES